MKTSSIRMSDHERQRHLFLLEWEIWRTRIRNYQVYSKAKKLFIGMGLGYLLSFFVVFDVFWFPADADWPPIWRYPARTIDCAGENGLAENLTDSCVVGPHPKLFLCRPAISDEYVQYYDGTEWPFHFYAPLVRLYKYLRRNDFK